MSFGQMLKICRKEKNFTQSELAELIGVSMQAVSKWETDAGMPDISQIVPLAKALEVSSDKLLGHTDCSNDTELEKLRADIGCHNISFDANEAERIYKLATPYFSENPTNPEVAFLCLEGLAELISSAKTGKDNSQLLAECERYGNCVFRYETDADKICKTYYVMSRAYNLLNEHEKADKMLERLPVVFGDRTYWEAEFAFADKNYDLSSQKLKESFAAKARFISRCIRMQRMINETQYGEKGLREQAELNEYMLRIINAFLSGGDYLPYRQIYQKISLLCQMVQQYAALNNADKAVSCAKELLETRNQFLDFEKNPFDRHCLLFVEGDRDGDWQVTKEKLDWYEKTASDCLKNMPQCKDMSLDFISGN